MSCKTHIVDCLNNIGVSVDVKSSSIWSDDNSYGPYVALLESKSRWFGTKNVLNSWWQIDFKQIVRIKSYMIVAAKDCSFTNNFTISISLNNILYDVIDAHKEYPNGEYKLGQVYNVRYLRIHGNADALCHVDSNKMLAFNYVRLYGQILGVKHYSCMHKTSIHKCFFLFIIHYELY